MKTQAHSQLNATKPSMFTPVPGGLLQRKCACGNHTVAGGECAECAKNKKGLQRKLTIGGSNDPLELEADRVADQVMAAPANSTVSSVPLRIQRFSGQANSEGEAAPASVESVLASSGRPLEPKLRQDMEQRFGHDFSQVRVHYGGAAEQSARDVNAHAYTVGNNVVFGTGRFAPETHGGRRLIAHELTHVVQQSGANGIRLDQGANNRGLSPISVPKMIQKEPEEEKIEEKPSAEDEAADRENSEALKDQIHDKYWELAVKIAKAQGLGRTNRRQKWIDILESKPATMLEAILTKEEPLSMWEVVPLHDLLTRLKEDVDAEDAAAYALWERTNERYTEERSKLEDEGDYESELALKYLDQAFDEHARRIDAIVATEAFVQEDILGIVYILDNRSHVKTAKIVAERERAEIEARLDELSEVQEEGPGFLETAWSIVGCDSIGECLGDIALTVATAGTGKALKFVVKGAKAVKKARKVRKVVRSAKKLGSTLHKFLKEAKALSRFLSVVKGAAGDAASTYAKWLKKDWKKIATKISTDLIANYTTGENKGAATVSTARINKVFIETLVENELGIAKPDPKTIKVAIIFFLGKKHAVAASLARTFILQSLKYRTTVNLAFESIRAGTALTEADEIFKRTVTSTIAEAAQDTVQAIPFVTESGLLKYITEAIRKSIQKLFG